MAWAERRGNSWRIVFRFQNSKRAFTLPNASEHEANAAAESTEELLGLLKRNMLSIPDGCSIEEFLLHKGKPPITIPKEYVQPLSLDRLREQYFASQTGKLELTTLDAIQLHFRHLQRILGPKRLVTSITRADLQREMDPKNWTVE